MKLQQHEDREETGLQAEGKVRTAATGRQDHLQNIRNNVVLDKRHDFEMTFSFLSLCITTS
jgi:hypothetical protein